MRKAVVFALCAVLIISVLPGVSAASGVNEGTFTGTVSPEGTCQVTLELQFHLDGGAGNLVFPIPSSARNIMVNGTPAKTSRSGGVLNVKLSQVLGNVAGDFNLLLQYSLPNLVAYDEEENLVLTLPLLSGFDLPVRKLNFSIQLPGEFSGRPDFISGYYHQTIESSINYSIEGYTLSGTVDTELKDREVLTMALKVPLDLFPKSQMQLWASGLEETLMAVAFGLALVYWIFFLRSAPFLSRRSTLPPEGCTAGELSGLLTGLGGDLTAMVFSWAQLGYILIQLTDSGRVILHKRMEMGNERGNEEVRLFRALFGKRRFVDGTGYHYASLCRKAAADAGDVRFLYKRSSGNPRVLRILCACVGGFSGMAIGRAMAGNALLGILLVLVLAVLGAAGAWIMQDWVRGLHLRHRSARRLGLFAALAWCLLGILAGTPVSACCSAVLQLLCGLAAAYGGRRTAIGRQTVSQMLGLRKHLKTLSPQQAMVMSRNDPEYFFSMAPYALALGVLKKFSRSFRGKRMPGCPYLTTGMDGHRTAAEWCAVMQEAAKALDLRYRRLFLEKFLPK